jgi:hypothetical protein
MTDFDTLNAAWQVIARELDIRNLPPHTPIVLHWNGWHTAEFAKNCVICLRHTYRQPKCDVKGYPIEKED